MNDHIRNLRECYCITPTINTHEASCNKIVKLESQLAAAQERIKGIKEDRNKAVDAYEIIYQKNRKLKEVLEKEHMRGKGKEHLLIQCWTCDLIASALEP